MLFPHSNHTSPCGTQMEPNERELPSHILCDQILIIQTLCEQCLGAR